MDIETVLRLAMNILFPIAAGFYLYEIILKPNIQGAKNRRQPTVTVRATVIGRDKNLNNIVYSGFYTRDSGDVCFLCFRTEEGEALTLTVPKDTYLRIPDGAVGTLTYQGTKCERFDADEV